MAITDANKLAAYIANRYLEEKGEEISEIKLQKTAYFSFVDYAKKNNKNLFNEKIEAWSFGPVIPAIAEKEELNKFLDADIFASDENAKRIVDTAIDEAINCEDYDLIKKAHMDIAWKESYNRDVINEISKDKILGI